MADIINDVPIIQELYIIGIREYTSNYHRRDVLEIVLQNGLYFCRAFVIKQRIKASIYKLFNQAHALYKGQIVFFLLVFQSRNKSCSLQVVCYKAICYEGYSNGLQIWLRFSFDDLDAVLLLRFAGGIRFPIEIIFSVL